MFVRSLLETHELYQIVINNLSDGVFLVDQEKNILVWNDTAERVTGYLRKEMIAQDGGIAVLDCIDRSGAPLSGQGCPVIATLLDGESRTVELFFRHKKGYRIPVVLRVAPIAENGLVKAVVCVFADNSVHIQSETTSSLKKLETVDQLTGLSNKRYSETLLERRLKDFQLQGAKFSVLFINLDDFSGCNAQYGYEVGNRMLCTLAESFRKAIRETDFIGRWGGEEFVGYFKTDNEQDLLAIAEKIRSRIEEVQMEYYGEKLRVTASIGATMASTGDSPKELVERSISLMHVSKISGKNCVTVG